MSPKYSLSNARLSNMTCATLSLCSCHFHICHTLCPAPCCLEGGVLFFSVRLSGDRCSHTAYRVGSSPTETFSGQGVHALEQDSGRNGASPPLVPFLEGQGLLTGQRGINVLGLLSFSTSNLLELPLASLQRLFTLPPLMGLISHAADNWQRLLRWSREETINRGDKPVKAGLVPLLGQGAAKALPKTARSGVEGWGGGICPALLWHFPLLVLPGSDNCACSGQSLL